jgi:hypothetical protein
MQSHLRFAEAVCAGHPDRLADTIADRIVRLACTRDPDALASIEVALYRRHVFVDGQILGGTGPQCVLSTADIEPLVQRTYRDAGYGPTAGGLFPPEPDSLTVTCELCLAPLGAEERELRRIADDQAIVVGHAVWGPRAGHIPLEQALANEFAAELDAMRAARPDLRMGPDGKVLVVVRGRTLVGVSISVHHLPSAEWGALTSTVRAACSRVGREFVEAGELEPFDHADWLVNGAGAFELGGLSASPGCRPTPNEKGLAEPFKGITTDGTPIPGLFALRSTGVSTEPVRLATDAIPRGPHRRAAPQDDLPRRRPRVAQVDEPALLRAAGRRFDEMSDAQREAAFGLLRASLSAKGLQLTRDIMRLNHTLGE